MRNLKVVLAAACAVVVGCIFTAAAIPASEYVQDGLVGLWDGIENSGDRSHDDQATVWKDLSGNGNDGTVSSIVSWTDNGNLAEDPLLRANFHIGPESPCCEAGANLGWEKGGRDLDGNPRLFRKRVDMGCYECQHGPGLRVFVR